MTATSHPMDCRCGECHCGCGGRTRIADRTRPDRGDVKGKPIRYIFGHHARACLRGSDSATWKGGRRIDKDGYVVLMAPSHMCADKRGEVREHVMIAADALGRPLPKGAQVHHFNGVRHDNRPENLVACQDRTYHALLHSRQNALEACGHADWVRCNICGGYSHPEDPELYRTPSGKWSAHRKCHREKTAQRYHRRKNNEARDAAA